MDQIVTIALFVIAASMLAFYLMVSYRVLFHSDAAMKLMLGEQMAKQFTLFPRDWNYVNDIWIIFPNLIAAPLSWFFKPTLGLHSFVDIVAAALVLYAAYLASRAVGIRGPLRWLIPSLLATSFSGEFAETTFGQSAYSSLLFTLLLLAGSAARFIDLAGNEAGDSRQQRRDLILIGILLGISVASGPRGIATYAAPLLVAAVGTYILAGANERLRAAARRLFVSLCVASGAGMLAFLILIRILRFHEGAVTQTFSDTPLIWNHLQLVVHNWLALFDALPPAGHKFSSIIAAIYAARLAVALFLFILPLVLLLRIGQIASTRLHFLLLLHAGVLASTLYLLIFTGIFVDEVHGAPRYLSPIVPTALLVMTVWIQETSRTWRFNPVHAGWLLVIVMLTTAPSQLIGPAFAQWPHVTAGLRSNPHTELVATLRKAGLTRGFAGYWNASVVSVLSGGDIRIAPVSMNDGAVPAPFHHLTSEQWYASDWTSGPTFLVLDNPDKVTMNRPALDAALGAPSNTLHTSEFDVLVYPFNLGDRLGYSPQPPVRLPRMTASTCAADVQAMEAHIDLRPNEFGAMRVRATNRSTIVWSRNSIPELNPGLRIIDAQGHVLSDARGILPHATQSNESVDLALGFRAPALPGEYTLYFSFVAEGEAWCGDLGAGSAKSHLSVHP